MVTSESSSSSIEPASRLLEGVRVLLIDGHQDTLDAMELLLQHAGADVRALACPDDALALMVSWHPMLVVSETRFGAECVCRDGRVLIGNIRRCFEFESVPAIALTSHAGASDRIAALEGGFQLYIAKPTAPAYLVEAIASLAPLRAAH